MRPTSVGAAILAALWLAAPDATLAQSGSAPNKCDSIDIFCGALPDLSTAAGWKQLYRQWRDKSAPGPSTSAAQDDASLKPGVEQDIEETPEERAAWLARSAAERAAAKKQADVEKARRESGYMEELAKIQVEDASTLRSLSADCTDNDKPSGYCMNDVPRARKVEPRMQAFLSNPEAAAMMARMGIVWRPESPIRAAAVKLPLEAAGPGLKIARDYVRANSLRDANGGFGLCAAQRQALIEERGEPSQAETVDNNARNMWEPDDAIESLAYIDQHADADSKLNIYRTCVFRSRWYELRRNVISPPPSAQTLAAGGAPTAGGSSLAASLFNQSAGQAKANPQATAAALAAQQNSRAAELDDLTRRGQARADAIMSAALVGIQTYVASTQAYNGTGTVSYGAPPTPAAAAAVRAPPARTVAQAASAPEPTEQPVRIDASSCVRVVDPKSEGIHSNFAHVFFNSCGYRVAVQWAGSGLSLDPHGWQGDARPSSTTPYRTWRQ